MGVEIICKCFSSWDPYVPPGLALNPFSNSRQFPSAHVPRASPSHLIVRHPNEAVLLLLWGKGGTEKVNSLPRDTQLVTQNWDSNSKPGSLTGAQYFLLMVSDWRCSPEGTGNEGRNFL